MDVVNGASTTSRSPARTLIADRVVASFGNRFVTERGKTVIDWQMGLYGPIYGYRPPFWTDALKEAAYSGPITSLRPTLEASLAALLSRFYPDFDSVRFLLNGSDPCAAAVKLARAATGRDKILVYGYHGTASAYAAPPTPFDPDDNRLGTLQAERDAYVPLPWQGMPDRGIAAFADAAAVIIECPPVTIGGRKAVARWLSDIADLSRASGALFVLDEVVTGFRYCLGGALSYYGLEGKVDLLCLGKTLGNGTPIAALLGKADVMRWLAQAPGLQGRVHWSNTFNGEPIGLFSALAFLDRLLDDTDDIPPGAAKLPGVPADTPILPEHRYPAGAYNLDPDERNPYRRMYVLGTRLVATWSADLPWYLDGHPTRPVLVDRATDRAPRGLLFEAWRKAMYRRGHFVVAHPWYVTAATTEADVDAVTSTAVAAYREALEEVS